MWTWPTFLFPSTFLRKWGNLITSFLGAFSLRFTTYHVDSIHLTFSTVSSSLELSLSLSLFLCLFSFSLPPFFSLPLSLSYNGWSNYTSHSSTFRGLNLQAFVFLHSVYKTLPLYITNNKYLYLYRLKFLLVVKLLSTLIFIYKLIISCKLF